MSGEGLIHMQELAKRLKVSTVTVRKWVSTGAIPKSTYIAVDNGTRTTYRFDYERVFAHLRADNTEQRNKQPEQLELNFDK